jgi:large subunit ribosomal protein L31e
MEAEEPLKKEQEKEIENNETEREAASVEVEEATEEVTEEEESKETVKETEKPAEEAIEAEISEEIPEKPVIRPRIEEEELEIVEERIYTIPLKRAWLVPSKKRASKAIRLIKSFIQRHMKVGLRSEAGEEEFFEEEEKPRIIVSNELNEYIWRRGVERPPRKVRIRAVKDKDGNVTLYPA